MSTRIRSAPLVAMAGLMIAFGQAYGGDMNINCDEGDSIQKAIDAGAGSAAAKTINVTGFCAENLTIRRDNISILGDGNTMISGRILVRGADGLTIRNLSITGPGDGISASVSRIFMTNVHIFGNYGDGIALRHGGAIFLRDGSISGNFGDIGFLSENGHGQLNNTEVSSNASNGIVVNVNGNLTMIGGKVDLHEQGMGITANTSSSVELEGVIIENNLAGVSVLMGSAAAINNSTINDNTDVGIIVESGTLGLNNVQVSGNRAGIAASMAKITLQDAQVVDNDERGIDVAASSALIVSGGAVNRNVGGGVVVDNGSSFAADGVDISDNGDSGVSLRWNSNADIVGCTIGNNAQGGSRRSAVFVSTSSSATIASTEIFGSGRGVTATRQSFVTLSGTTVVRDNLTFGLRLVLDSGAVINEPVIIPTHPSGWAVNCYDTESSLDNRSTGVGLSNCKGFDLP